MTARKPGFYWVKFHGAWEVARYSALARNWVLFLGHEIYVDTALDEIGPRLEPPK